MRYFILMVLGIMFLSHVNGDEARMCLPQGDYDHRLGMRGLDDPSGKEHTRRSVAGRVVVVIFSSPTWSQGGAQKRWAKILADDFRTRVPHRVALFLVEDMSQAGWFKGMAERRMRKQFTPTSRPLLLLDKTGHTSRKFGVKRDSTEILIFDKTGRLRDVETHLDDISVTTRRVRAICRELEER
jgi:hypothetical protein